MSVRWFAIGDHQLIGDDERRDRRPWSVSLPLPVSCCGESGRWLAFCNDATIAVPEATASRLSRLLVHIYEPDKHAGRPSMFVRSGQATLDRTSSIVL